MSSYILFAPNSANFTRVNVLPAETKSDDIVQSQLRDSDKFCNGFYIVDLGVVREQFAQWVQELPNVTPYFAIKCNPNLQIIKLLAGLGANFDCASLPEIEVVLKAGVSADRIIYANPCKFPAHIKAARAHGVHLMTADNADEIDKIASINPDAQIVLRIATDDQNALCKFSSKFGAYLHTWDSLLERCRANNLNMRGVSFHVGSGSYDNEVYPKSLKSARDLFNLAAKYGFAPDLVDLGGGFPGTPDWEPGFPEIARGIREALEEYFPASSNVRIIAEPGRYFVAHSHTLVARIIARRFLTEDVAAGNNVLYYIDEGYYQSFNCIVNDHYVPKFHAVSAEGRHDAAWRKELDSRRSYKSTIFGPTCDSIDTLYRDVTLPLLDIGEWLVFNDMGAYTCAPSAPFNGYICTDYRYVDTNAYCVPGHSPEHIMLDTTVPIKVTPRGSTPPPVAVSSDDEAFVFKTACKHIHFAATASDLQKILLHDDSDAEQAATRDIDDLTAQFSSSEVQ